MNVVETVLEELGAGGKRTLTVLNKADLVGDGFDGDETGEDAGEVEGSGQSGLRISATRGDHVDELLAQVEEALFESHVDVELLIPYERGDIVSMLLEKTPVSQQAYTATGTLVTTRLSQAEYQRLEAFRIQGEPGSGED
jgi:GTP-binding protein HflX